MVGKIFIHAEEIYSDSSMSEIVDYIEHDYPRGKTNQDRGWFFIHSECESNINEYQQDYMLVNNSRMYCVDRCFCGLYRIKLWESIKQLKIKRSWVLLIAGFKRMVINFRE